MEAAPHQERPQLGVQRPPCESTTFDQGALPLWASVSPYVNRKWGTKSSSPRLQGWAVTPPTFRSEIFLQREPRSAFLVRQHQVSEPRLMSFVSKNNDSHPEGVLRITPGGLQLGTRRPVQLQMPHEWLKGLLFCCWSVFRLISANIF